MSVVALDLGRRRIGIAASDAAGLAAYPVTTVERHSLRRDIEVLGKLLAEREAEKVIVGLPLNMDGSEGAAARSARAFARALGEALHLVVELQDERLTSFEARERLKGGPRGRRRREVDAVAAALILEDWLDTQRRRPKARRP